METMDRKFDTMLSLQVLDKSKAIAQILQEVLTRSTSYFLLLYIWFFLVFLLTCCKLFPQEEMQKAAFQALQLQKDSVHGFIRNQVHEAHFRSLTFFILFIEHCKKKFIFVLLFSLRFADYFAQHFAMALCHQIKIIEGELMQLTKLEVKRRNLDAENLQVGVIAFFFASPILRFCLFPCQCFGSECREFPNGHEELVVTCARVQEVLVQQREALGDLLQQLLKQRDQREQELRQILVRINGITHTVHRRVFSFSSLLSLKLELMICCALCCSWSWKRSLSPVSKTIG